MRTFKEFMYLTERYYEPDEKLPSGRTPLQKATDRAERPYGDKLRHRGRQIRQRIQTNRKVKHGADNPNLNRHSQNGLDIDGGHDYMRVHHRDKKISYRIDKTGKTLDGRNVYDVQWNHHHRHSELNDNDKKQIARDAKHMWDHDISHRLPHNSVLKNFPVSNSTPDKPNKNTRAKLYQRAGFGEVGKQGYQFASVGREPSYKQKKKGKTRLSPMPGNTEIDYDW